MRALTLFALSGLSSCLAHPAMAQGQCAPVEIVEHELKARHGEVPFVEGVDASGRRFVIFANPDTKTWTVALQPQPGAPFLCGVAAGDNLKQAEPVGAPS